MPGDFVSTLLDEPLLKLTALARHPALARAGKPRHVATLHRYRHRGVRGIYLEAIRNPDGWYSSVQAWYRFVARLTAASQQAAAIPNPSSRKEAKRQSVVEAEIDRVRARLGKKPLGEATDERRPPDPESPQSLPL
jgi:hypothetical protein